jgi:pimeloyl-ACP methyl ester carboxylesterase
MISTRQETSSASGSYPTVDLIFLPGLDGTGLLIDTLLPLLPSWIHPVVIAYPLDRKLSYPELRDLVLGELRGERPFILLAESFSGPVAALVAERNPPGLRGVILSASFVTNPLRRFVSALRPLARSPLFVFPPPKFLTRRWLTGRDADDATVIHVQKAIAMVDARILAFRVRHLIGFDARLALRAASVPIYSLRATEDRVITEQCQNILLQTAPGMEQVLLGGPHLLLLTRPKESAREIVRFATTIMSGGREEE